MNERHLYTDSVKSPGCPCRAVSARSNPSHSPLRSLHHHGGWERSKYRRARIQMPLFFQQV